MFDFTGMVEAFNVVALLAGITALSAIMFLPGAVRWGYNKIVGWFSQEEEIEDEDLDDDPELDADDFEGNLHSGFECEECDDDVDSGYRIHGKNLCWRCAYAEEGPL